MTRPFTVLARGVDMTGEPVEFRAEGLLARCVQHETDHLDGVLFLQRLDSASRKEAMRSIRESSWFTQGITVLAASEIGGGRSRERSR